METDNISGFLQQMTPDTWINIFSAIILIAAIVVSLFIGLRSLRITQKIEEKKYRIELLNEINKWGIDVLADCWRTSIRQLEESGYPEIDFMGWREVGARTRYITSISAFFKRELLKMIEGIDLTMVIISNSLVDLHVHKGATKLTKEDIGNLKELHDIKKLSTLIKADKDVKLSEMTTKDAFCIASVSIQDEVTTLLDKINDLIVAELRET